uniref:Uncharacterized protein n=1 Tax=Mustela putorius furo TaxID=9669 RepID=M3XY58_MUSPF
LHSITAPWVSWHLCDGSPPGVLGLFTVFSTTDIVTGISLTCITLCVCRSTCAPLFAWVVGSQISGWLLLAGLPWLTYSGRCESSHSHMASITACVIKLWWRRQAFGANC